MRIALFWAMTQRVVVITYRRFGQPTSPTFKDQAFKMNLSTSWRKPGTSSRNKLNHYSNCGQSIWQSLVNGEGGGGVHFL